jgi:hypothetical protein
LDDILEEVQCTELLANDIIKHSEELQSLTDVLHQLWNLVPVEWKDSVFKSVQKGLTTPLSMHPVNAIQSLQGASSHVNGAMKGYIRAIGEFVDNAHSQTNAKRIRGKGRQMPGLEGRGTLTPAQIQSSGLLAACAPGHNLVKQPSAADIIVSRLRNDGGRSDSKT